MNRTRIFLASAIGLDCVRVPLTPFALAQLNSGQPQILSTNQTITPLAPRGATYQALNPGVTSAPDYTVGPGCDNRGQPGWEDVAHPYQRLQSLELRGWAQTGVRQNPAARASGSLFLTSRRRSRFRSRRLPYRTPIAGLRSARTARSFTWRVETMTTVHIFSRAMAAGARRAPPVALGHLAKIDKDNGNFGGIGIETEAGGRGSRSLERWQDNRGREFRERLNQHSY